MKLVRLIQGTKEWLDWRRSKVTASDTAIIMGISPYKTIDQLIQEKIKAFEIVPNSFMKRGRDLEPLALAEFEKETGLIMFPTVGTHDEHEWMGASFDGMTIEQDFILEIKCNGKKNHALAMKGEIPPYHHAQVQHQIFVADLNFSYYYSFDGEKGIILEIKRDQAFIDIMIEKEKEFWYKFIKTSFI